MTTNGQEYPTLLRRGLVVTASCIVAVVICYVWLDRAVALFVYDHHINKIEVFRWLTYPPPEVQNWVALGVDDPDNSTRLETISALAKGAPGRVYQLDRCR